MNIDLVIRAISLCIALAGAETLHGIARTIFLVPRVGKERALKLSIVSGSLLAFVVCYVLVPGMGLTTLAQTLWLGCFVTLFMACFDLAMGKLLLRRSWSKAFSDFNPATGNLLVVGLALLTVFPTVVVFVLGRQ